MHMSFSVRIPISAAHILRCGHRLHSISPLRPRSVPLICTAPSPPCGSAMPPACKRDGVPVLGARRERPERGPLRPLRTAMTLRPDGRSIVSDAPKGFADDKWMQERTKCFDKPLNIYEVHAGSWRQKEDAAGTPTPSWPTCCPPTARRTASPISSLCPWPSTRLTAAGATRPPAFLRPPAATARRMSLWSLSTPATSRGSALSWTLCRSTLPWMPTV